ncbi:hypothetical protein H4R33_002967 [Dimargaris cristalligena]|nr:hypothetical protein H4R33_002967 [Dimargaris cristalligena]
MVTKVRLSTVALVFLATGAYSANIWGPASINNAPDEVLAMILGWAEEAFFANPESYNTLNLGPAEADAKLAAFMPLVEITILPAFVHLIYQNLDALGYDKLGQPLLESRPPGPHVANNMILWEALETFRPELQWLQKNTHNQQFDTTTEISRKTFLPFHDRLMKGELEQTQTMSEYFLSAAFGEALSRNFYKYVPESYIQFLATLLYMRQSVDPDIENPLDLKDYVEYAKNQEFHKARYMTVFLGYIMLLAGNSTFDTLYSAIGFGAVSGRLQPKEHQLALLVASIQGNNHLVRALIDPQQVSAPIDNIGACAVQRGWISREQITLTLAGDGNLNPPNCELFMFRAIYPIHLDAAGKTVFHLYDQNPNPVNYDIPTVGPLAPPVVLNNLVDENEVYLLLREYIDEHYIPNRTPGSTPQSVIDNNNALGPPPAIRRVTMPPPPANWDHLPPMDNLMPPNGP